MSHSGNFHTTETHGTRPCNASSPESCPLKDATHFDNRDDADKHFHDTMTSKHGALNVIRKKDIDPRPLQDHQKFLERQQQILQSKAHIMDQVQGFIFLRSPNISPEMYEKMYADLSNTPVDRYFSTKESFMNSTPSSIRLTVENELRKVRGEIDEFYGEILEMKQRAAAKSRGEVFDESSASAVKGFKNDEGWSAAIERVNAFNDIDDATEAQKKLTEGDSSVSNIRHVMEEGGVRGPLWAKKANAVGTIEEAHSLLEEKLKADRTRAANLASMDDFVNQPTGKTSKNDKGDWVPNMFHRSVIEHGSGSSGDKASFKSAFQQKYGWNGTGAAFEKAYNESVQFGWLKPDRKLGAIESSSEGRRAAK